MFKKWNVTYTNAATGDTEHKLLLNGPQKDEDAVREHVEKHVKHTVGAAVFDSKFVRAEEVG
jgi:hypothetical protein